MTETKTDPLDFGALTERLEANPTAFRADTIRREIAAELVRSADIVRQWQLMHGLGQHIANPCLRCEAWERAEVVLRARARELEEGSCSGG
ncbi:hypothetical protein SAMN05428985_11066 [Nocardioides sp. YR527]|uniref:hypothetical protein n=1 Tax=Nocardioides sp. YR527 TaxID=1881028 RepID=UPI00088A0757|nr:hypothetical protein [Nocardioides sp. YR527]SDL14984.1 hypothetical protein SAMN05428985_11066 [Nocardioides sp. YR527]